MTKFDKLRKLCKDQGRAILTSDFNNRTSIVITDVGSFENIYSEIGGEESLEYYSGLLIPNLEGVALIGLGLVSDDDKTSDYYIIPKDDKC